MNCHICKKYFEEFDEYRAHLQRHYDNDSNKKWMECDFGCKDDTGKPVLSLNVGNFIAHIASHTKQKPFKCNVTVNGIKCKRSTTTKGALRRHWESMHLKKR
eukprot:UN03074